MTFKAVVVSAVLLMLALPSVGQEYTNLKEHGAACLVGTIVSQMSSDTGAYCVCGFEPFTLLFKRQAGGVDLLVGIKTSGTERVARSVHVTDLTLYRWIPVTLRVDEGDMLSGAGHLHPDGYLYFFDDYAAPDKALVETLLPRVKDGRKLYISIEKAASNIIELDGADRAVADFLERLKLGSVEIHRD